MHLANYLGLLHRAELALADAYEQTAEGHAAKADVHPCSPQFAQRCRRHAELLQPHVERYGAQAPEEPERLHSEIVRGNRAGGSASCATCRTSTSWPPRRTWPGRSSGRPRRGCATPPPGGRRRLRPWGAIQLKWLRGQMKVAAPQALVVAE